jgi:hypothetical protein
VPVRWSRGDRIVVRYFRGQRLHEVRPVTVVADGPDGLVLWLAPGTPLIRSSLADGRRFAEAPLHERYTTPVVRHPATSARSART